METHSDDVPPTRVNADHARREQVLAWRGLGISFLIGAIVDLVFGVAILLAAEPVAPLLRVTLPEPRVYLDLNGLLLCGLGAMYLLIWRAPERLAPIAAAATLLRFGGAALFATGVATGRAEPTFALIAGVDLSLALAHAWFLRQAAGSIWNALRPAPAVDRPAPPRL